MTVATQESFIRTAAGQFFDPDGVYNFQCVDVAVQYAIACFPGVSWETTFGRGNAKDHFPKNNAYWQSIANVAGDLTSFPQRGDIVIWGGDGYNPYGHIAVVVEADAYTMLVLQQNVDGSGQQPCVLSRIGYDQPGTGGCVGWLRPKIAGAAPITVAPASSAGTMNGIDISMHQAGMNVAATGAQFTIIKATEGVGYADPEYKANLDRARRAGDLIGHYHFARPGATGDNTARAEADWFVKTVKPNLGPDDVVILDWEADRIADTAWAAEWLRIVGESTEKTPWVYMNQNAANTLAWPAAVKAKYPLWGAAYPSSSAQSWGPVNHVPSFNGWNLVAWQYSQTGRLPGYAADVDLNVFYGTAAAWRKLATGGAYKAPLVAVAPAVSGIAQCVVEAGDTLSGIATQFKTTLAELVRVNPGINPDLIYPGQVLNLPTGGGPAAKPAASTATCVVEAGDTLAGIATQFKVDLGALVALNGLTNPDLIFPGQVLKLPSPAKAAAPVAAKPVTKPAAAKPVGRPTKVVVEAGDSMSSIAKQFGVTLPALTAANPQVKNPNVIQVGWVLNMPAVAKASPAKTPAKAAGRGKWIVDPGDTLSAIAAKYPGLTWQAIAKANGITNPDHITVGQVLNLP